MIQAMISISVDQLVALPVDRLGLLVLDDLIATKEWNAETIERVRAGNMQTLLATTPEGELVGIVLRADLEIAL